MSRDHHRSVSPSRVCDTPAVPFCSQQCGAEPRWHWRRTAQLPRTHPSPGPARPWSGTALHRGMWKCLWRRDRLGWPQPLKMGTPDCSKHKDKQKATWVTLCHLQGTATRSAWGGEQLIEVMKAKAHLTPQGLRRRQPPLRALGEAIWEPPSFLSSPAADPAMVKRISKEPRLPVLSWPQLCWQGRRSGELSWASVALSSHGKPAVAKHVPVHTHRKLLPPCVWFRWTYFICPVCQQGLR